MSFGFPPQGAQAPASMSSPAVAGPPTIQPQQMPSFGVYGHPIEALMEFCPTKSLISGVMGFGLGGLFGVFTASIDWGNSSTLALRDEPFKVQVKHALKDTRTRAWQMGKSFGSIGLVYAGVECVVEGYRAKNDIWNAVTSGCITGSLISLKAGPGASAFGCVGFAAFSAAMEKIMGDM